MQFVWTDEERLLLPLLPMIWTAWADGELEPEEIREIRNAARCVEGVGASDGSMRAALDRWLDPDRPPPEEALQRLRTGLRRTLADVDAAQNASLTALGATLNAFADSAVPEEALADVEAALAVDPRTATAEFVRVVPRGVPSRRTPEAHGFDPRRLTALLERLHAEDRAEVRRILSTGDFTRPVDLCQEDHRELVLAWTQDLADRGLFRRTFPTMSGGAVSRFIAVFETLAYFDLSLVVKVGVQFGLFGGALFFLGTERHHALLDDVVALRLAGCFAMTERGHGSNVRELGTVARWDYEARRFVLTTPDEAATKEWIGNAAAHGRAAVVFAQLVVGGDEHGVHAFLTPIRDADGRPAPGVRIGDCGHKLGLNGVDNGLLHFDGVELPREALLDRYGSVDAEGVYTSPIASPAKRFFTMLSTLVGGRVAVASAAVSVAKAALTIAIRHGARRRQFGPPDAPEVVLLDYPSHQRRLMPRLAQAYAFSFATRDLQERYAARTEEDAREVESLAAGVKALATWAATDTAQACREACGAQGYAGRNRFADLKADCDVFTTFEGDNTVLLQLVAKSVLTRFRHQFADSRLLSLARHLASLAGTAVAERNPVVARRTDSDHLRDPEWHADLLAARELDLTASVATRLRRRIGRGEPAFDAFTACQNHLLALAHAHVEGGVVGGFRDALEELPEGSDERRVLNDVYALYALGRIEADVGWFQEQGYLEGGKPAAIRKEVDRLCAAVRAHALGLVDAFDIPDALLGAPIGTRPQAG